MFPKSMLIGVMLVVARTIGAARRRNWLLLEAKAAFAPYILIAS